MVISLLERITKVVPCEWLNTDTCELAHYGIKVYIKDSGWRHLAADGKPCWFDNKRARDDMMRSFRKSVRAAKKGVSHDRLP